VATFATADGRRIEYQIRGAGPLIALTPGGREAGDGLAALTDALAPHAKVLTWDRCNGGASDVHFEAARYEQEVWADDLADLVRSLGAGPAWIAGGSAGCRASVVTVLRHPEIARGLVVWSASGGAYGCQFLGFNYHVPFIMAAQRGGMEAVAQTPFFAQRIAQNPRNRDRLLALDPEAFVAIMKGWNEAFFFQPDAALAGVPDEALRTIRMPTLIFEGNDDIHPESVSRRMAELIPGARLTPSPWSRQAFMDRLTGRTAEAVFSLYPMMAPAILDFIARA
jgi:pimeloyl-ACP methyl ester carboxylesterase